MYKAGRVLCVNHGIGMPSASIMLHEVAKLLHYARARDVSFVRMGTSGGVGVPAGSIVVTTEALNGLLEPKYTIPILGRMCSRNTQLSPELAQELVACAPSDRNVRERRKGEGIYLGIGIVCRAHSRLLRICMRLSLPRPARW